MPTSHSKNVRSQLHFRPDVPPPTWIHEITSRLPIRASRFSLADAWICAVNLSGTCRRPRSCTWLGISGHPLTELHQTGHCVDSNSCCDFLLTNSLTLSLSWPYDKLSVGWSHERFPSFVKMVQVITDLAAHTAGCYSSRRFLAGKETNVWLALSRWWFQYIFFVYQG